MKFYINKEVWDLFSEGRDRILNWIITFTYLLYFLGALNTLLDAFKLEMQEQEPQTGKLVVLKSIFQTSATPRSNFWLQTLKSHVSPATRLLPKLMSANPDASFPPVLLLRTVSRELQRDESRTVWVFQLDRGRSSVTSAVSVRTPSILSWSSHLPPQTQQRLHSKLCSMYLTRCL